LTSIAGIVAQIGLAIDTVTIDASSQAVADTFVSVDVARALGRVADGEGIPVSAGTETRAITSEHTSGGCITGTVEDRVVAFGHE